LDQIQHHVKNNFTTAYLGLGSNLGDRADHLNRAIELLDNHTAISVIAQSSHYDNPAIEGAGPQDFLNSVIEIQTSLNPIQLLDFVLDLEMHIDPDRNSRGRKLSRQLDIDILRFGDLEMDEERLILPHPRMQERDFVMKPLEEIKRHQTSLRATAKQSNAKGYAK
jgi:2-amino-4-hydroxy-6-hydroxymethyldihydropteridine diphosphokinase